MTAPDGSSRCLNCGTALAGRWCQACGQDSHHAHRSLRLFVAEGMESLSHADGRLWHTLFGLAFRPGRLTREYIQGRRAAQIPPLRLFLVALLFILLAGTVQRQTHHATPPTPAEVQIDADDAAHDVDAQIVIGKHKVLGDWLKSVLPRVAKHPDELSAGMLEWSHRLAVLLLPIAALVLSLLYVTRRDLMLFDHLVFATHSLSFLGFLSSAVIVSGGWAGAAMLLAPLHLFVHMRGTYGSSVFGTLLRMALLGMVSLFIFAGFILGVMALSAAGLPD